MSNDPADLEKTILASNKRFEIFVPKPNARINLGQPATKKHPDGPYGHAGITMSAKDVVFIEAGKEMVLQSGADANMLVSGNLGTYASGDVQLTSGGDMRVSAAQRLLVISGSHNDPSTLSNHDGLRLQAYNNLAQHYRINSLEVGLFEFFHGRRDRPKRTTPSKWQILTKAAKKDPLNPSKWKPGKRRKFDHSNPAIEKEITKDPLLQGGFTKLLHRSLSALYPAVPDGIGDKQELFFPANKARYPTTRKKAEKGKVFRPRKNFLGVMKTRAPVPKIPKLIDKSDPRVLIEPLFTNDAPDAGAPGAITAFGGPDLAEMEYGFSRYFNRFDPYKIHKPEAFSGWAAKAIITMMNTLVRLRRKLDCLLYAAGLPSALADLGMEAVGAAPVIGPLIGAVGATMEAYGTVSGIVDQYVASFSNPDTANPFQEKIAAFGQEFAAKADPRKASVKSAAETWDLSKPTEWDLKVTNQAGKVVEIKLSSAPVPARAAKLTFHVDGLAIRQDKDKHDENETAKLAIEVDGHRATLSLDPVTAPDAPAVALLLAAKLGSAATVSEDSGFITIVSPIAGAQSRILIEDYTDNHLDKEPAYFGCATGQIEHGEAPAPAIADLKKVTADEIIARLSPHPGVIISNAGGAIRFTSELEGNGSKIEVSGKLANLVFKTTPPAKPLPQKDHVRPKISPDWENMNNSAALIEPIKTWVEYVGGLPAKTQALFEPITNALEDVLTAMSALESVAEGVLGVASAGGPELPDPPESVGIFGAQGITLGTHDRIIGQGGHGILFIVDGASGEVDKGHKQGKPEFLANFAGGFAPPMRTKQKPSFGFRVFSDSLVDLVGGDGVQLLAMGRGKSKADRPGGKKVGGIGVARVLSSWVTEVAADEKVIISARSKGKAGDTTGTTGGRVELAGQTIAIGGVRNENKDPNGDEYGPFDFDSPESATDPEPSPEDAHKTFGITPIKMEEVALGAHLTLAKRKKDPITRKKKAPPHLKANQKYAWPRALRRNHPVTERVHMRSEKEVVIAVGPYMLKIDAEAGITVGRRKANKDPGANELDETLGTVVLDDRGVVLMVPNKDKSEHSSLSVFEGQSILVGTDGSGDKGIVSVAEGSVTLGAGTNDQIEISKSDGLTVTVSKLDATSSGNIKLKGSQIHIG